jgi:hydrogenase maturation protease
MRNTFPEVGNGGRMTNKSTNNPGAAVICVGNEFRSDDGVGVIIARKLKKLDSPELTVIEESGEGASLMEAWEKRDLAIVVDASNSGERPGTVFRFDAHQQEIPTAFFHYSTHAFSVAEAVAIARSLEKLPAGLIVYAIEGKNFEAGTAISPEVEGAVGEVIERILSELKDA